MWCDVYKIKLWVRLRVATIRNASYAQSQVWRTFGLWSWEYGKSKWVTSHALLLTVSFENIKSIVFLQIQNTWLVNILRKFSRLYLVLKGVVFTTLNLSVKCVHRDWFDYRSKIALTTWFCREMEHTSFIILQHTFMTSIAIKNQ